jgi:hypothetical protein
MDPKPTSPTKKPSSSPPNKWATVAIVFIANICFAALLGCLDVISLNEGSSWPKLVGGVLALSLLMSALLWADPGKSEPRPETFWGFISELLLVRRSLLALILIMLTGSLLGAYYILKAMITVEATDNSSIVISLPGQRVYYLPITPFGEPDGTRETGWQNTQIKLKKDDHFKVFLSGYVSPGYLQGINKLQTHFEAIAEWEQRHKSLQEQQKNGTLKPGDIDFNVGDIRDSTLFSKTIAPSQSPNEQGKPLPGDTILARSLLLKGATRPAGSSPEDIVKYLNAILESKLMLEKKGKLQMSIVRILGEEDYTNEPLTSRRWNRLLCETAFPETLLKTGVPTPPRLPNWPFSGPDGYTSSHYAAVPYPAFVSDPSFTVQGLPHNSVVGLILREGDGNRPEKPDSLSGLPGYSFEAGKFVDVHGNEVVSMKRFFNETEVLTAPSSGVLWVCINDSDEYRWDNAGIFFMKLIIYSGPFAPR